METNQIIYEAAGGEEDSNSWTYKLCLKHNSEFVLKFHLRSWQGDSNWSDASVDNSVYTGNFTVALDNGLYALAFSNIHKSGDSQANGDWSGPKPISAHAYPGKMSAVIKADGTCDFKKERYGVYMKSIDQVKEFFKTYFPTDSSVSKTLNGIFYGDTTTQAHKDYDDWYCCADQFELSLDGSFRHLDSYCNHDYDSGLKLIKSGNYVICNDEIRLGKETLKTVMENGKLSYANWGQFKLGWTGKE